MVFTSNWMISLKVLLISAGVVSIAIAMKVSVPLIIAFVINDVPLIWSSLAAWLRPPYLYVVINGIIITIAATSRFHHKVSEKNESEQLISPPEVPLPDLVPPQVEYVAVIPPTAYDREIVVSEVKTVVMDYPKAEVVVEEEEEEEEAFQISRSTWMPPQRMKSPEIVKEAVTPVPEKPPLSANSRFTHRKPLKASPEGSRALRVSKPKKHDTLENTWKAITDGRHIPLNRHLKKSDTFENHGRQFNSISENQSQEMKKSETFRDRTNYEPQSSKENSLSPAASGKLRKEASPSQDELNRRVEAFIKKFNDEMRLQRQESLNQYVEMVHHRAR